MTVDNTPIKYPKLICFKQQKIILLQQFLLKTIFCPFCFDNYYVKTTGNVFVSENFPTKNIGNNSFL